MNEQPYTELSDLTLLALCVWREAQDQPRDGMQGVAHVIRNRTLRPGWWGHDWHTVILKPWQFSSFNASDPNSKKWPADDDPSWAESMSAASGAYLGLEPDVTDGAQYYYDTSIGWPKAWGNQTEYTNTLNVGRLKFWRHEKPRSNHGAVQDASSDI